MSNGFPYACTCSEAQLYHVGCDCTAGLDYVAAYEAKRAASVDEARLAGCVAAQAGQPRECPYGPDMREPISWHAEARRAWFQSYDNAKGFERDSGRAEPLLGRG